MVGIPADEVVLTEVPRSGWAVTNQQDLTVALDTVITPELRKAGVAREMIRLVQTARKEANFDVTDRILLSWAAAGETADALREHAREVADAVLALEVTEHPDGKLPPDAGTSGARAGGDEELGERFWLIKAETCNA